MADTYFEDATHKTTLAGDEAIPFTFDPGGSPSDAYITADEMAVAFHPGPTWTAVSSFSNSWVNFGSTSAPAGYWKDLDGFVHLRGVIKSGTVTASAFTLPAGYRPAYAVWAAVPSNSLFGACLIGTDGTVKPQAGSNTWFSLDGISFPTA